MVENKCSKTKIEFNCSLCNYTCSKKSIFDKHLSTAKHKKNEMLQNVTNLEEKMFQKYYCEFCDVKCTTKYGYDKHCLTAKHIKMLQNVTKNIPKNICEICNKEFNNRMSLWRHKNNCFNNNDNTMMKLQNEKDKDNIIKLQKELIDEQQKLIDIKQKTVINQPTVINNNTINNFNLNVFLNETCKDAMSLEDFIDSIELTLEDYVNTGEKGFVKGISDIVVNKIKGLEQHHRPVHCTDLKRQVLYVKNHDKWEKDQDKMNLRNAVNKVAKKNVGMASVIKETIDFDDTKNCDDYIHHATYFYNALGGDGDEKKNEDDIIKNVLKEVTIDKESGNN